MMINLLFNRAFLFLVVACFCQPAVSQNWSVSEMAKMPIATTNNAVCEGFANGKAYVLSFTGMDSTKTAAGTHLRSFKYDIAEDSWEEIESVPDPLGGKVAASANWVAGIIYIIGGYHIQENGAEISSKKVHRYDVLNEMFLSDGADIPIAIDDQVQVVWRDSLIYVISGWSNSGNIPDVQIYDTRNDSWQLGTKVPFFNRWVFGGAGSILNDTIFYFGGARNGGSFPANNGLVKGVINPDDPTDIAWESFESSAGYTAYRPASCTVYNDVHWLGGSVTTYNYNGIAYNGSGGVSPSRNDLNLFDFNDYILSPETVDLLPMDLRGIANINETIKYIAGGMEENQMVSNKTLRLEWLGPINAIEKISLESNVEVTPNPVVSNCKISFDDFSKWDELNLVDAQGKVIYTNRSIKNTYMSIPTSRLQRGVYFVALTSNEGRVIVKKLVKI